MFMNKHKIQIYRNIIALVMMFSLIFGLSPVLESAAATVTETYDFTKLGLPYLATKQPDSDGRLTYIGDPNSTPKLAGGLYGTQIQSNPTNPAYTYRSFNFIVKNSGYYLISLEGLLNTGHAGLADIYIDTDDGNNGGTKVISGFSFYKGSGDTTNYRTLTSQSPIALSEGTHKITFKVVGKDAAAPGSATYYMVPAQMTIEAVDAPQIAVLVPATAAFDKNPSEQTDITVTMAVYSSPLTAIKNGTTNLIKDEEYTVSGNTVTIKREYFATLSKGSTALSFDFESGNDPVFTVIISDSTIINAQINPTAAAFDKNLSEQADVTVTMSTYSNTLLNIKNGAYSLIKDTDYTISESIVKIKKDYLTTLDKGIAELTFDFDNGNDPVVRITVSDSTPRLESVLLDFKTVSLTATNDWYLTRLNPTAYPVVTLAPTYGASIGTSFMVPIRSFSFNVSDSGVYSIDFTGFQVATTGAVADIFLDTDELEKGGEKIISRFSFNKKGSESFKTASAKPIYLEAGVHKFTFKLVEIEAGFSSGYMYPSSFKITKLANTISPITASFDIINKADISVSMQVYRDAVFTGIRNGEALLLENTDFIRNDSIVTIKKEYLEKQPLGAVILTFEMDKWNSPQLYIENIDSTPVLNPNTILFDKNSDQMDNFIIGIQSNGYAFEKIKNGAEELLRDRDYIIAVNNVTITSEYLQSLQQGNHKLTFLFTGAPDVELGISVIDTSSKINPVLAAFDKKSWADKKDITVTMEVYGEAVLNSLKNGNVTLEEGKDYTVNNDMVYIKKEYLNTLTVGKAQIVFDFDKGNDPILDIHIVDTTPPEFEISGLSVVTDLEIKQIRISGNISTGAGKLLIVKVTNPHGNLEYLDQTVSTINGEFIFVYNKQSRVPGVYNVTISGESVMSPVITSFIIENSRKYNP